MKRSYLLVYALVIISLLSMVVIKITENTVDKNRINSVYKDNFIEKYEYESAAHHFLAQYTNDDLNQIYKEIKENTSYSEKLEVPLTYDLKNAKKAVITLVGDDMNISIASNTGHNKASIRLNVDRKDIDLEKILENNFEKENIIRFLKKDLTIVDNLSIEGSYADGSNILLLGPYKKKSGGTTNTDRPLDDSAGSKKNNDFNTNPKVKEESEEKIRESTNDNTAGDVDIAEKLEGDKNYLFGPKVAFKSDEKINSRGILYIDENTTIDTPSFNHSGLVIIKGKPQTFKSNMTINGALINPGNIEIDQLTYNIDESHIFSLLDIDEYDMEYRIDSFIIE